MKTDRARQLRSTMTNPERLLWAHLRRHGMNDLKFRRQQPIGPFVADFVCFEKKLIIELDGGHHAEQRTADQGRDRFFLMNGYRVLRFWNAEVMNSLTVVLDQIFHETAGPLSRPSATLPLEGGG